MPLPVLILTNVVFLAVLIGFILAARRVAPESRGRFLLLGTGILSLVLIGIAVLVVFTTRV